MQCVSACRHARTHACTHQHLFTSSLFTSSLFTSSLFTSSLFTSSLFTSYLYSIMHACIHSPLAVMIEELEREEDEVGVAHQPRQIIGLQGLGFMV